MQAFSGDTVVIDVDTNDSISVLHEKIHSSTGIARDQQRLVLQGKHIDGDHSVLTSGMWNHCTVRMLMGLRGGMAQSGDNGWSAITDRLLDSSKVSPSLLERACREDEADAAESLVTHYGVDKNACGPGDWTALHTAMVHRSKNVARRLVELGAQNKMTTDGVFASVLRPELWAEVTSEPVVEYEPVASSASEHDAVHTLVQMMEENRGSMVTLCRYALAAAEQWGSTVFGKVDEEAARLEDSPSHWTVITAAVRRNHHTLSRVCLELGGEPVANAAMDRGVTGLIIACRENFLDIVRLLLQFGADIDKVMVDSATPLHLACQRRHHLCAQLLVDRGADVNLAKEKGYTPLHTSCWKNAPKCVQVLLNAGADAQRKNDRGETPLEVARRAISPQCQCAQLLQSPTDDASQARGGGAPQARGGGAPQARGGGAPQAREDGQSQVRVGSQARGGGGPQARGGGGPQPSSDKSWWR